MAKQNEAITTKMHTQAWRYSSKKSKQDPLLQNHKIVASYLFNVGKAMGKTEAGKGLGGGGLLVVA